MPQHNLWINNILFAIPHRGKMINKIVVIHNDNLLELLTRISKYFKLVLQSFIHNVLTYKFDNDC